MNIKSIKKISKQCTVYDIGVEKDHSFIVQECVLHNCVVCGSLDSTVHKQIKDFGINPPAHFSCRCLIIPRIKGFEELEEDSTRASENGQVDSKITFNDWLKEQPEDVQKDVLGEGRYRLYKLGEKYNEKIKFENDGRIVLLDTLKENYSTLLKSEKSKDILEKQQKVDKKVRDNVIKGLIKNGCVVNYGKDDEFLEYRGSEGLTFITQEGITILYHSKLSASGLFEEVIHYSQIKKYGYEYCKTHYHELEIQAKEKLLTNKKVYNITKYEEGIIKDLLEYHRKEIEKNV